MSYIVYKYEHLEKLVNDDNEIHYEICNFFNEFNDNKVTDISKLKNNSQFVFINEINKNETKSSIIQLLNKLNKSNLQKIYISIREIPFSSNDEINELIKQCIIKIKQESNINRPLVGNLCKELSSTFFIDKNGQKIHFAVLMLKKTFEEYKNAMNFESSEWEKEKAEKSMILLGTLINSKIIETEILEKIIEDFKKRIVFIENQEQTFYEEVEKSMQLLSILISTIIDKDSKDVFINAKIFIDKELDKYENNKCITRKTRIFFKDALSKLVDNN
jgi:hypothetical protein